ncbi:MAG: hypothetical protein U0939_09615 [Pirellulales bacterium]
MSFLPQGSDGVGTAKGEIQQDQDITAGSTAEVGRLVFYRKLNELLAKVDFDRWLQVITAVAGRAEESLYGHSKR